MSLPYTSTILNFRAQHIGDGKFAVKFEGFTIATFVGRGPAAVFARDLKKALRRGVSGEGLSVYGLKGAIDAWLNLAQSGLPWMNPPGTVLP